MRLVGLVLTITSACVLLLASAGPAAAATDVSCGQQITSPGLYTFSRDLVCTEDIRIEAPDVTIDLQGHTLTGTDTVWGAFNLFAARGVEISNGTITGVTSGAAVQVSFLASVTLHNLTITENDIGVWLWSTTSARVEDNLISSNGTGVRATPGSAAYVENNRIVDNSGAGITAFQTWGGSFSNNFIARNGTGIFHSGGPAVTDNKFINNRGNGLTISGNILNAPYWVITGNFAFGNGGYGIWSDYPVGISSGNRAAGNGSTPQCWNVVCSPSPSNEQGGL